MYMSACIVYIFINVYVYRDFRMVRSNLTYDASGKYAIGMPISIPRPAATLASLSMFPQTLKKKQQPVDCFGSEVVEFAIVSFHLAKWQGKRMVAQSIKGISQLPVKLTSDDISSVENIKKRLKKAMFEVNDLKEFAAASLEIYYPNGGGRIVDSDQMKGILLLRL